jgi:serine/threonine protein kinase
MILEFCGEGDLEKYIMDKGQLPEKEAVHILYEVQTA